MKHLIITILIFIMLYSCNSFSGLKREVIGCWISPSGKKIYFMSNGDYIVNDTVIWDYEFIGDSTINIFNTPFDSADGPSGIHVDEVNSSHLILFDSLFWKETKYLRCKSDNKR